MNKRLEIKGIIGIIAALLALLSYVIYYIWFYEFGIRLDKLFFISSGISISIFSGLLFTFFQNTFVKVMTLFCSVFYFILVLIYCSFGLLFNEYYAHIKLSLIIGLIAGIIYYTYDAFINSIKH